MQNVFFNLEGEWIKKAKRYIAYYNFKHVDEEPISFSTLACEALRETLRDGLGVSEILENISPQSDYQVCMVGLTEEDVRDLENAKQKFREKGLNVSSGAILRASVKKFSRKTRSDLTCTPK